MDKIFKHNEFEGVFDDSDYTVLDKLETAFNQYTKTSKDIKKKVEKGNNYTASKIYKDNIQAIAAFFDTIFGDGSSNKILGGTTSFDEAAEALAAFTSFYEAQIEARREKEEKRAETLAIKLAVAEGRGGMAEMS